MIKAKINHFVKLILTESQPKQRTQRVSSFPLGLLEKHRNQPEQQERCSISSEDLNRRTNIFLLFAPAGSGRLRPPAAHRVSSAARGGSTQEHLPAAAVQLLSPLRLQEAAAAVIHLEKKKRFLCLCFTFSQIKIIRWKKSIQGKCSVLCSTFIRVIVQKVVYSCVKLNVCLWVFEWDSHVPSFTCCRFTSEFVLAPNDASLSMNIPEGKRFTSTTAAHIRKWRFLNEGTMTINVLTVSRLKYEQVLSPFKVGTVKTETREFLKGKYTVRT